MTEEELKKAKLAYQMQKKRAKRRGILFLLTFEEWLDIWVSSGHWEQRGRGADKYCMSRVGDLGGYEVGNVFIQLHSDNVKDAWTNSKADERKAKMKEAQSRPEVKAKMKEALARPEVRAKYSGDNNYKAKLTKEQVDSIFNSPLPGKELAELYKVGQATISRIKRGKHYHQKVFTT